MALSVTDREWIEQRACAAGFDVAGVAAVASSTVSDERYAAWVAAGHAGEMEYLKRADDQGRLVRGDLRRSLPWAESVIVCAVNYNADAPRSIDPAERGAGWIARYAWSGKTGNSGSAYAGSDYHDVLLDQLRVVEAELRQRFPACETRCYVDTGPLPEREYALRAGIGWIGRNTCVINQQKGSWMLLGVIVTSLVLEPAAASVAAADRCGSCTRCIDACPTDALFPMGETRQMDATRCIAYLTIEKKGDIPEDLRAPMGRQVFGCDICQEVCPWNRRAPVSAVGPLPARRELVNPALEWLGSLDGPAFNRLFRQSPVERTRRKRLLRNVAIAMGNSGETRFLAQLDAWAAGDEPVLAEAASWAAARLRSAEPK